jgi:hypothetical protein
MRIAVLRNGSEERSKQKWSGQREGNHWIRKNLAETESKTSDDKE